MSARYINPKLPSVIRGLYRADLRERSIQIVLDLAADLVQELIDLRAAEPAVTDEMVERACLAYAEAWFAPMRAALEAALSTEKGQS